MQLNKVGPAGGDRGSTLVTTVVVMLTLMVFALTAAAVTMNSTRSLTSGRHLAQARVAADAGLAQMVADATRAGLDCPRSYDEKGAKPSWTGSVACKTASKTAVFLSTGHSGSSTVTARAVFEYQTETSGGSAVGALVSGEGEMGPTNVSVLEAGDLLLNKGRLDCNNASSFSGLVAVLDGGTAESSITNHCKVAGNLYVDHGSLKCDNYGAIGGDVIVRDASTVAVSNNCKIGGRLFVEKGNFTCANNVDIAGDVIVRNGTATLSGSCRIGGRLISQGSVTIQNSTTIEGDVATTGSLKLDAATVLGSVRVAGTVDIRSWATVGGALESAGSGNSYIYNANLSSALIGGSLSSDLLAKVSGVLEVVGTSPFKIAPATTGALRLAGSYTTWGSPQFTAETGATDLTAPTVTLPAGPATPSSPPFNWIDLPYDKAAWTTAGWNTDPILKSPQCDLRYNGGAAVITDLTVPSVVDARGCSSIEGWQVELKLKTDIVLIVNSISAGEMKIKSADGSKHLFSIVVPDSTADGKQTCASGQGVLKLQKTQMDDKIHGIAYSPCTIEVSNNPDTIWHGQIYGGKVNSSIGGIKLYYEPITLPGLAAPGGGGGGGGGGLVLGSLVAQGDCSNKECEE